MGFHQLLGQCMVTSRQRLLVPFTEILELATGNHFPPKSFYKFPSYAPATPGPQISYGHTPGPASNMRGPPSNAVGSVKRMNVADQQPQSVQSEYPPATPRSALDNGVQSPQIQNIGKILFDGRF